MRRPSFRDILLGFPPLISPPPPAPLGTLPTLCSFLPLCNFTVSPPASQIQAREREITPHRNSLTTASFPPKDGYLDILTQAMPTASPYEISTRQGKGRNGRNLLETSVSPSVMITTGSRSGGSPNSKDCWNPSLDTFQNLSKPVKLNRRGRGGWRVQWLQAP